MGLCIEYEVRCSLCGHAHDEPIEWLIAHREVVCPAEGCEARIQIEISELTALIRISKGPGEVFDLSKWKSEEKTCAFEGTKQRPSRRTRT